MVSKRKILLFGGSFNPPTLAHEAIIEACLALPEFDEVWVMPSGSRNDKAIPTSDEHRQRMAEIVRGERFASDPRLVISDFELGLPRPTSTYRTVAALAKAYPDVEFWWALGADSYHSMPTPAWEHGAELQKTLNLLVFSRDTGSAVTNDNVTYMQLPPPLRQISSTHVRSAIAENNHIDAAISPPVLRYIREHNLYGHH
jgi:nicotinate-nucleotide adenylyltransferase